MTSADTLETHLSHFGLRQFRPGQRDVIETVMAGRDCLCVMPTGGGKSLCYQLPAAAGVGLTVVVSPLIALMKDQVDQLAAIERPATYINSTLAPDEIDARLEAMTRGDVEIVYVAPERFRSGKFLAAIGRARPARLAIDEAHCISEWGHDFRPDYARLGVARRRLGKPPTIALTATATPDVRADIARQLDLDDPRIFVTGFARENLEFSVALANNGAQKQQLLLDLIEDTPGAGIVYGSTRKRCEEVAELIRASTSRRTVVYHAGLELDARRRAQEDFMQSRAEIVVATNAFGMGIDKPDVRFVAHFNMPGSLEAYYQEAGRAGRDGQPSRCLLLYSAGDRYIQEFFIDNAHPPPQVVAQVYEFLRGLDDDPIELTLEDIKDNLRLSLGAEAVGTAEQILERARVLRRLDARENMGVLRIETPHATLVDLLPRAATVRRRVLAAVETFVGPRRGEVVYFRPQALAERLEMSVANLSRALRDLRDVSGFEYVPPFRGRAIQMLVRDKPFDALEIDLDALAARRDAEYDKLDRVAAYANGRDCRQRGLLEYFGDPEATDCQRCDNCQRTGSRSDSTAALSTTATADAAETVRRVLQAVAALRQRFGKGRIAQMLTGSTAVEVEQAGLTRQDHYGLLRDWKQTQASELLTALVATGMLEQHEPQPRRPIVRLSSNGAQFLRESGDAEQPVDLDDSIITLFARIRGGAKPEAGAEIAAGASMSAGDGELRDRLRDWRRERAAEENVPAYRVLTNAAIDAIAAAQPTTREALAEMPGIGPHKLKCYAGAILDLVGVGQATEAAAVQSAAPQRAVEMQETTRPALESSSDDEQQPEHYWTWQLIERGFTLAECAAVRRISRAAIIEQVLAAARADLNIDWQRLLGPFPGESSAGTSALDAAAGQLTQHIGQELPPETARSVIERWRNAGG